jgi:hypothetical protein
LCDRAELVTKLIRDGPLSEPELDQLLSFGWDSDDELVALTKADAVAMLDRHRGGAVSTEDLVRWADQIEGREDIGFEPEHEADLAGLIIELANPTLQAEPTSDTAHRWLRRLE